MEHEKINRAIEQQAISVQATRKLIEENGSPKDLENFDRTISLQFSLIGESDRAVAIMGAEYLNTLIEELISEKLVHDKKMHKDIFEFNGALGSFSAKIDFAFLLGLISKKEKSYLHIIRKIRNNFAHEFKSLNFNDENIKSMCGNLYAEGLIDPSDPKSRYRRCLAHLFGFISHQRIKSTRIEECDESLFAELGAKSADAAKTFNKKTE